MVSPVVSPYDDSLPRCPHCSAQPIPLKHRPVAVGPVRSVVFYCGFCQAVLTVQLMEVETKVKQVEPQGIGFVAPKYS